MRPWSLPRVDDKVAVLEVVNHDARSIGRQHMHCPLVRLPLHDGLAVDYR